MTIENKLNQSTFRDVEMKSQPPDPSVFGDYELLTEERRAMNGDQISGTIRTLGALLTGWVVGSGAMPPELWAQVVPVVAGLAVWGWSMWSKKPEVKK
jgi:hypothetical protein